MNAFEILEDDFAKLIPLDESHVDSLWPIAQLLDIHKYGPSDISSHEKLKCYLDTAIQQRTNKLSIPFVIQDKRTEEIVGCTRFGNIDPNNRILHIGWTWVAPVVQGTGLNTRVKYLMLHHAFNPLYALEFRYEAFRCNKIWCFISFRIASLC